MIAFYYPWCRCTTVRTCYEIHAVSTTGTAYFNGCSCSYSYTRVSESLPAPRKSIPWREVVPWYILEVPKKLAQVVVQCLRVPRGMMNTVQRRRHKRKRYLHRLRAVT